ncbi:MAG: hypothetical protein EOM66_08470 [Clostridia bacterium]|nr:hypothetical protein [Clostridia bacterium]
MAEQVTVLVERCTMQIFLDPFFESSTQSNIKRMLRYVFQEPWRNEETIAVLGAYFPQKISEAKAHWAAASKKCQDDYVCTNLHYEWTAQQKHHAECGNKRRLAEVKSCKRKYERWLKISADYKDLKQKA